MSKKLIVMALTLLGALALLAACGGPSNLREFVDANAADFQEIMDDAVAEAEEMSAQMGIELIGEVTVSGNDTLVYSFIFGAGVELDPSAGPALTAVLESMDDFQTEVTTDMRRAMGIDTLYVTIRYIENDGTVLAERTFAGH